VFALEARINLILPIGAIRGPDTRPFLDWGLGLEVLLPCPPWRRNAILTDSEKTVEASRPFSLGI